MFVDSKGKHHFSRALEDADQFRKDLIEKLGLTEAKFDNYIGSFKAYRDKFIAHLDEENMMNIPHMKVARRSAKFLYQRLLVQEAQNNTFADAPLSAKKVYKTFLSEGLKVYQK